MKKLAYLFIYLTFTSCVNSSNNNSQSTTESTETIKTDDSKDNSVFKVSNRGYSDFEHEGVLVYKKFWRDKNGRNTVLFAKTKFDIYVYHYLIPEGDVKLLHKIKDGVNGCDADLTLDFIYESVSITDLNNDDIGEITFTYTKACISDLSPVTLNLYTMTGENQYHISGQAAIFIDDKKINDSQMTTSTFNNTSESLRAHAEKTWTTISETY